VRLIDEIAEILLRALREEEQATPAPKLEDQPKRKRKKAA
jgi:hypothetical protein